MHAYLSVFFQYTHTYVYATLILPIFGENPSNFLWPCDVKVFDITD